MQLNAPAKVIFVAECHKKCFHGIFNQSGTTVVCTVVSFQIPFMLSTHFVSSGFDLCRILPSQQFIVFCCFSILTSPSCLIDN